MIKSSNLPDSAPEERYPNHIDHLGQTIRDRIWALQLVSQVVGWKMATQKVEAVVMGVSMGMTLLVRNLDGVISIHC